MIQNMKLSQFQFILPKDRVAQEPARWRDECKLLVLDRKTGNIEHRLFKDIIDYFGKGDTFVFNDTKVFPARLFGKKEKTGADIMVFLLRELNREQRLWDVIVEPARKIRIGNKLYFGEDESLVAEVIDNTTSRGRTLRFLYDGPYEEFKETLFSLGETPVPFWVKPHVTAEDRENYQTIFAAHEGAVSAPAAGMHFSRELFNRMILKDIEKPTPSTAPRKPVTRSSASELRSSGRSRTTSRPARRSFQRIPGPTSSSSLPMISRFRTPSSPTSTCPSPRC